MHTMKAAILDSAPGGLRVEEIPVPEPRAGEVLVKVSAFGVCHTDLHVMKAEVAFPTPAVMGHEISGTVAGLGPGVAGPPVGTRVASAFIMPCGFCPACGAVRHGADLRGGERIAVVATGGVGINIIQIAKAFGASQIIAVDIRDDKLEAAKRLRATDLI